MQAILDTGGQLAPNQVTRLLDPSQLLALQTNLRETVWLAWGLTIVTVLGFVAVARPSLSRGILLASAILIAAIGLAMNGLPGFPVLLLGFVAMLGSLITDDLFVRAKRQSEGFHVTGN